MEEFRCQLRLNTLLCVDPHASNVVAVAGRTALYNYDQAGETWSKTDVEGTLIIYTRKAKPKHMITIVNKNSKSNFVEPITRNCDAQLKMPYVLLRNDKMKILGIWFADETDVPRIFESINSFIKQEFERDTSLPGVASEPMPSGPGIAPLTAGAKPTTKQISFSNTPDIMSMLSQAHGEFETKRIDNVDSNQACKQQQQQPSNLTEPSPMHIRMSTNANNTSAAANEATSPNSNSYPPQKNTVADFFAKVGVGFGQPKGSPQPLAPQGGANDNGNTPLVNSSDCNTNPMLQQLFQGAAAVGGQATVVNNNSISNPISIPGSSNDITCSSQSGSLNKSGSIQSVPMSVQELEGKLRKVMTTAGNSTGVGDLQSGVPFNELLMGGTPSSKPNLISPQMFTAPKPLAEDASLNAKNNLLLRQESLCNRGDLQRQSSSDQSLQYQMLPQSLTNVTNTMLPPQTNHNAIHDLLKSTVENNRSIPANNELLQLELHQQQQQVQGIQRHQAAVQHHLTQRQFVMALSHALTKEDFVRQLYQAYEEVVLLKKS